VRYCEVCGEAVAEGAAECPRGHAVPGAVAARLVSGAGRIGAVLAQARLGVSVRELELERIEAGIVAAVLRVAGVAVSVFGAVVAHQAARVLAAFGAPAWVGWGAVAVGAGLGALLYGAGILVEAAGAARARRG
jgi:hypothetical protein